MTIYEIRDPLQARQHVLQSLWLSRHVALSERSVSRTLDWCVEIASEGAPLPLSGFVCDVGHIALGTLREPDAKLANTVSGARRDTASQFDQMSYWDAADARKYEDYVLGKLYADMMFERGADALLRFQGRDRSRGVAYVIDRFRDRAGFDGAILAPAVLRAIQESIAEESIGSVLEEGRQLIDRHGLPEYMVQEFRDLIVAVRNTGEVLGAEDVFELESGTALEQFGQRVALRQILQAADLLERSLPREKVRPLVKRQQVATHIVDEDMYPVGGYSSLSNRGTIESLLFSQLAFMEPDNADRPDLFDVKYLRDELVYYSRDENQFLRRRQTFVFAIYPDLFHARFKDNDLPWQRIVLVLAMLVVIVRKQLEWLSDHALTFEFLFLHDESSVRLADEQALIETLLREQIANGTVFVSRETAENVARHCSERGRRSLCHLLTVSKSEQAIEGDVFHTTQLLIDSSQPRISFAEAGMLEPEESGLDGWSEMLITMLRAWSD